MSADASAKVIIGFEVRHEDFWIEQVQVDAFVSCENGHRGGQEGKFCSECGGLLGYQRHSRMVANPNFAKFIGDDDPEGPAGEAWNPEVMCCAEEQFSASSWPKGFGLHCGDRKSGSDDGDKMRVIGKAPLRVGDICGGMGHSYGDSKTHILDERGISELFDEVRDLANKLGIDRPVQLFLTSYCSY